MTNKIIKFFKKLYRREVPIIQQDSLNTCGPACLAMIGAYYGKRIPLSFLIDLMQPSSKGVDLLVMCETAESLGFKSHALRIQFLELIKIEPPFIVHWGLNHFVVVTRIKKGKIHVADPLKGYLILPFESFIHNWISTNRAMDYEGIVLFLEPTINLSQEDSFKFDRTNNSTSKKLIHYFFDYKLILFQLIILLIIGACLQLIAPFLTKSIVDIGIARSDLGFIQIILLAQIALLFGRVVIDFLQSWIIVYLGTSLNMVLLNGFFEKLVRLPLYFYDSNNTGDLLQRMGDTKRIESFLTGASISTVLSIFNLLLLSFLLILFSVKIFIAAIIGNILYALWVASFLKRRRNFDYERFDKQVESQSNTIQLIQGMQEIKLNGAEEWKKAEWKVLQNQLRKLNIKAISLDQYQNLGSIIINDGKNIVIILLAATDVIEGSMTLGTMLSIQTIIGQFNGALSSLIGFIQNWQNAMISMSRIDKILESSDEEPNGLLNEELPENCDLRFQNLFFSYTSRPDFPVLKNISFEVKQGTTTAIVGTSGSGKTTILKLLLKYYNCDSGDIYVGSKNLKTISHRKWRSKCGIVMQDSFIFSDSIEMNIAISANVPDYERVLQAATLANIHSFVQSLPNQYLTKIGKGGIGLSAGQKQRILIARAIYKNPDFIFLDEATNSLDSINENDIMKNIHSFFYEKTIIIIAHRLSTVRSANQIIVMKDGEIAEIGNHESLLNKRGEYFKLIQNQVDIS